MLVWGAILLVRGCGGPFRVRQAKSLSRNHSRLLSPDGLLPNPGLRLFVGSGHGRLLGLLAA